MAIHCSSDNERHSPSMHLSSFCIAFTVTRCDGSSHPCHPQRLRMQCDGGRPITAMMRIRDYIFVLFQTLFFDCSPPPTLNVPLRHWSRYDIVAAFLWSLVPTRRQRDICDFLMIRKHNKRKKLDF